MSFIDRPAGRAWLSNDSSEAVQLLSRLFYIAVAWSRPRDAWPITLYSVNPITMQKFREAFVTSHAMDDAKDARYLAELLLPTMTNSNRGNWTTTPHANCAFRVQLICRELKNVLKTIETFEDQIAAVFKQHPDREIFHNLPGAGPTLAPRLLASLGSERERFPKAVNLQCYSGIAPVTSVELAATPGRVTVPSDYPQTDADQPGIQQEETERTEIKNSSVLSVGSCSKVRFYFAEPPGARDATMATATPPSGLLPRQRRHHQEYVAPTELGNLFLLELQRFHAYGARSDSRVVEAFVGRKDLQNGRELKP